MRRKLNTGCQRIPMHLLARSVREVAGMVNSKSSASSVPATVGSENVPSATPLNIALPSTRNGRLVGPPHAVTSGRHSSRLEVEREKCSVEVAAKIPEACTREAGVDKLNSPSSSESLSARILTLSVSRQRQFCLCGMQWRVHVHAKSDLGILGLILSRTRPTVPLANPAG